MHSFCTGLSRIFLLCFVLFMGCEKDEVTATSGEGRLEVDMTDAPVDDPDLRGVFVTVTDLRVDGTSVEGFSASTVEVSALQNGRTQGLFSGNVEAKSYNRLELVLDDQADATGGSPGCYALTEDGKKVALEVANNGVIAINNSTFALEENATVRAVVDFDLRKAVQRTEDEAKPYRFAASSRLNNSLRFTTRAKSGTISGKVTDNSGKSSTIVVYAYASGAYSNAETEGDANNRFLKATSSTRVKADGSYTLAFLESGTYELVAAAYADEDDDGHTEFSGTFNMSAVAGVDLGGITVDAESQTTVDIALTALLP